MLKYLNMTVKESTTPYFIATEYRTARRVSKGYQIFFLLPLKFVKTIK